MSMNDPISNMITCIRNGQLVYKRKITIFPSKIKISIIKILKENGYIKDFNISYKNKKPVLTIILKYYNGKPVIEYIKRISKPGVRIYKKQSEITKMINKFSTEIITTSIGVMTSRTASVLKLGGELLFIIR